MPVPVKGPLTDADYKKINQELARQDVVRQHIEMARQAGINCAAEDEACQAIREQISKIKAVYFPDRS